MGSDGLVTIDTLPHGLVCRMWNPDGSQSGMCGNGIRCTALFSRDAGLWQSGEPFWMAERRVGVLLVEDQVQVQMGKPSGAPWDPARTDLPPAEFELEIGETLLRGWGVSFGNPHIVIPTQDIDQTDIAYFGPRLEKHPSFPASTNVHFVQVVSPDSAKVLHWERGAGITLGCGSGACAVYAVLRHLELVNQKVSLNLPGGTLLLDADEDGVLKTGPAAQSFTGFLDLNR